MNCRINLSLCVFVLILFLTALPVHAQVTCYVDDDAVNDPGPGDPTVSDPLEDGSLEHPFDAIQEACDAGCEEIIVLDGTYTGDGNRDIDCLGPVTLMSENGADTCVIDCEGNDIEPHRAFYFHSGQGLDTVVEGFTIQNCYADGNGGAILCELASSPTIRFCTIIECTASESGGAIFCTGFSSPDITNCVIGQDGLGNTADTYSGGGIACVDNSSPTISSCTIEHNTATNRGGGIYCLNYSTPSINNNLIRANSAGEGGGIHCREYSTAQIANNTISNNSSSAAGGGIRCYRSSPLITLNTIEYNDASGGGGLYCEYYSSPNISSNTIQLNDVTGDGGGIYCDDHSSPTIANNLIVLNTAGDDGGGIYVYDDSSPVIYSTTINENSADGSGGGIYGRYYCSIVVTNCILWDDTPQEITNGGYSTSITVTYSDVEMSSGVYPGEGNINLNPLFVPAGVCCDVEHDFFLSQVVCGDWYDSPCVDSGSVDSASICFETVGEDVCMNQLTTGTCLNPDLGQVDMGYHCPCIPCPFTQQLTCSPSSGVLPFVTQMAVTMESQSDFYRTLAGRIDVRLANGTSYSFWRAGYTNLAPYETYATGWNQYMPALGTLEGENFFTFVVMDVTPYPYNQPPSFPASGCIDSDMCTVEGISP